MPLPVSYGQESKTGLVQIWEYPDQKKEAEFLSLDKSGLQIREENNPGTIPEENLVRLSFSGTGKSEPTDATLILLENGDRLFVQLEKIEEDLVYARWIDGDAVLKIPLETVRSILLRYSGQNERSGKLLQKVYQVNQSDDYFILNNNDTVTGELKGFKAGTLSFSSRSGEQEISVDQLTMIVMNRELVSFPETKIRHQFVRFRNGSWLNCENVNSDEEKQFHFQSVAGMEFSLDSDEVREITFLNTRVRFLTELESTNYQHTPYLSRKRELKINRNNSDQFLKLHGVEYPVGLGMYSQSSVSFPLEGQYTRLFGVVGVDDEAGSLGSVIFTVEADQRKIFESPLITKATSPMDLGNLDLGRCRELVLRVQYGDNGDIQDLADWCDLIVIK